MSARHIVALAVLSLSAFAPAAMAQFSGFQSKGLVAVARIPADTLDANGRDTFGGISGLTIAPDRNAMLPWVPSKGRVYKATLFAISDRGFGEGTLDYSPRIHQIRLIVRPGYGAAPRNDIAWHLDSATYLTYNSGTAHFTGFDASPDNSAIPKSFAGGKEVAGTTTPASLGIAGRNSIDPEAIARKADGSFFVSDEYGALVYNVGQDGRVGVTMETPAALTPKTGATFDERVHNFGASPLSGGDPDTGRRDDRGIVGLSISPDAKRLVSIMEAPLVQDSGDATQRDSATNSRIILWDIDPKGRENLLTAEYVYPMSTTAASDGVHQVSIGDILAINQHQFLVLESDNYGRGQNVAGSDVIKPTQKRLVLVETNGATNLYKSGYDKELGDRGQLSLPPSNLNGVVTPVTRLSFIDLLDPAELARFGLNVKSGAESDSNSISQKWEAMTLMSLNDATAPDDYLLFVANDNGYQTTHVIQEGKQVGSSPVNVDTLLLVYRVTLPGLR